MTQPTRILFVCMGNICRSPTAEGVFRALIDQQGLQDHFVIDSAGTHDYHVGRVPDGRAQQAANARGIDISGLRARQLQDDDFDDFDHILVMDRDNHAIALSQCPRHHLHKIKLFLDYAPDLGIREVPDPYYGGASGFEQVLDMLETAARGFLQEWRNQPSRQPNR